MAATTITLSAGNNQQAAVSTLLPIPLAVLVTDGSGLPVSGVVVNWQVGSGGGSLSSATSTTNASGIATVAWTLGGTAGSQVVTADVSGLSGTPVLFFAVATPTIATLADFKSLYRIQTSAEDALITAMLARAYGEIQGAVFIPFGVQVGAQWYDDAKSLRLWEAVTNLMIPYGRYLDQTSVVVTDQQGNIVDPSTYLVRPDLGLIMSKPGSSFNVGYPSSFPLGPYSIVANVGFGTAATYATVELPQINDLILLYAGMLYQQRTPGAAVEKSAGSTVTYKVDPATGLPDIVARGIRRLRGIVIAA